MDLEEVLLVHARARGDGKRRNECENRVSHGRHYNRRMGTMDELEVAAARVDLAAAFRLAVRLDLHEGVCNHFSYMLPEDGASRAQRSRRFFLNRYGLHWSEVSASNLLMFDADGNVLHGEGEFEKTAFYIHS